MLQLAVAIFRKVLIEGKSIFGHCVLKHLGGVLCIYKLMYFFVAQLLESGLGGLEVACWPLVPKFAGSNPAEAVRFFGRKNPQCTFLRRGSKAVGPMS